MNKKNEYIVTSVFKKNFNASSTVVLNEGGARSSKSHSICQLLIYKLLTEKHKKILITRKTLPSLRVTAYKMFIDLLAEYGLYDKRRHNKTLRTYTYNTNWILFTSIDDPTKIQSTEFNYIWMEEAEEFTFDDFVILKTRLSGKCKPEEKNQMFLTYNPKQEYSFINKKLKYADDITFIKSTYKDNPMISSEYIKLIEGLKTQNERLYKVFALGEYANIDGQIYTNINVMQEPYPGKFDEVIYGLDFGFNNPSALIKIGIKDKVYYISEMLYETGLTNRDLIERLEKLIPKTERRRTTIYADASEPGRIEEIYRSGFNIKPAEKKLSDGIDFVKRCEIFTSPQNTNFNAELSSYCYRKDKNGNLLDEPVKFNDHLLDALRYALYTHSKKRKEINIRLF